MADFISREKAIETIRYRVCQGHGNKEHICKRGSCAYCGIMEIMEDISSIEAADVQHGYWTDLNNDAIYHYECSCCKGHTGWHEKFCPNCGARMDGDCNQLQYA